MSSFRNIETGVVVSVDDSKDDRYSEGWERADTPAPTKKATANRTSSTKTQK